MVLILFNMCVYELWIEWRKRINKESSDEMEVLVQAFK